MKIKGAISVLKKEAEFFGMTFDEVLVFIEQKPWAASKNALDAYEICRKEFFSFLRREEFLG
jgi:hypothetical protein